MYGSSPRYRAYGRVTGFLLVVSAGTLNLLRKPGELLVKLRNFVEKDQSLPWKASINQAETVFQSTTDTISSKKNKIEVLQGYKQEILLQREQERKERLYGSFLIFRIFSQGPQSVKSSMYRLR
eukprot:TRINITY_DN1925_c0_g1_i12.p1 TRINITY_DN1925_c0_g1~~TRINITY_DN1925_c0_g1_i12.p1  ORF type:complete len:124 (-),score=3.79 TRINITY_DN1925_c0_g1_i12:119-490(-)